MPLKAEILAKQTAQHTLIEVLAEKALIGRLFGLKSLWSIIFPDKKENFNWKTLY